MKKLLALSTFVASSFIANGAVSYVMNGNALFEHSFTGTNSPPPIPSAGSANVGTTGTFSWGDLASDNSDNFAEFSGTNYFSRDWGGEGTFTSSAIDVSGETVATIRGVGENNIPSKPSGRTFFNFFYQLDGGAPVAFGSGISTSIDATEVVDVSGISQLLVGFTFWQDSSQWEVEVTELSVDAVPEPSTLLLGGLALLGLARRRR